MKSSVGLAIIIFEVTLTILICEYINSNDQIHNDINIRQECNTLCDPRFGIIDQETGECYCATEKIIEENMK